MAAWSALGVFFMSDRETEMAPGVCPVSQDLGSLRS
jgi:hypothetical protein